MRVFIAGGLGFVGGRIAVHLAKAGNEIVIGTRSEKERLDWLPEATVVRIDWNDVTALTKACEGADVLIHAAGMNARESVADPAAALASNGVATARLFAAANRAEVVKFVYFSTAHVYASPLNGTITEKICPKNRHPYAASHLAGELSVLVNSSIEKTQGIVLRLSNAFGVPTRKEVDCWTLLINDLCKQAAQKQRLILRSTGEQTRDFISLTEVCRVVERIAICEIDTSIDPVFNVGTGVARSVIDAANIISERYERITGLKIPIFCETGHSDEKNLDFIYKIDKLSQINFQPNYNSTITEIDDLLKYCIAVFG